MKTITLPGKTISVGVRLTAGKQSQAAALTPPNALVAFDGGAWASNITTTMDMIPVALQWGGVIAKSAGAISWMLGNPDEVFCNLYEAPSSTSAALFFQSSGTVTVTAMVDGLKLIATITREEVSY